MLFTPPKIYPENLNLAVRKWHVEYRFLNPKTGRKERFKVYEDINRQKGDDKIQYAQDLRMAVYLTLKSGFNPFVIEKQVEEKIQQQEAAQEQRLQQEAAGNRSSYTIIQALNYFLGAKAEKGVAGPTTGAYTTTIDFLKNWLNGKAMLLVNATEITATHLLTFIREYAEKEVENLEDSRKKRGDNTKKWSNKTYNNHLGRMQTILNFLALPIHNILPQNPIQGAEYRTTVSRKHKAYEDEELKELLKLVREREDVYMEGLILTTYYAAVRSKAEMRDFKIENILFDRDLILLAAEGTKARREDYIPLDPLLKEFFVAQGFDKLPKNFYVFGSGGKPGHNKAGSNYYSLLFREYRDTLGFSERHTLYATKHTRAIHLAKVGVDIYEIMQLFRHTTPGQTATYLRDLGCTISVETVKNSRKL